MLLILKGVHDGFAIHNGIILSLSINQRYELFTILCFIKCVHACFAGESKSQLQCWRFIISVCCLSINQRYELFTILCYIKGVHACFAGESKSQCDDVTTQWDISCLSIFIRKSFFKVLMISAMLQFKDTNYFHIC